MQPFVGPAMRVSTTSPVPPSADAQFHWRVGQFQPPWRHAIGAIASDHPALADLAESFPALLFALASDFGTAAQRRTAARAVMAGAPLQTAADLLHLAPWTRRLCAGAFHDPLPQFPIDADFSRRIANLVPEGPAHAAVWLRLVSEASPAGGRQYVLWTARHAIALSGTLSETQRMALHAWVWMGWHPGLMGHRLVRRPWAADIGIKRMMEEFACFLSRVALADTLGDGRLAGVVDDLVVHGLMFKPLRTAFDYITTAAALDNCLEQYADRLQRGSTVVAAILDHGQIIGCVEMGPHPTEGAMPSIIQLRTAKNRRASAALWSAAYAWLAAADMRPLVPNALSPSAQDRQRVRDALWGPFLQSIATTPGGQAFHARATAALSGDPPSLDQPLLRRPFARPVWPDAERQTLHETLLERLAALTGRGAGRRMHR